MIRWYFKFRIRRAIEQRVELPRWVQKRMEVDGELAQYAKDYAWMIRQLSSGAESWMQEQTAIERPGWSDEVSLMLQSHGDTARNSAQDAVPSIIGQTRFRSSASLRWAACIVAAVLLTSGLLVMRDRSNRSLARQELTRNAEMAVAATRAVLDKSHWVADQCQVAWNRTMDKFSRNMVDRIGESTVAPIENGGRWLGEAIKELRSGAVREQNGLIELSNQIRSRFEGKKSQ